MSPAEPEAKPFKLSRLSPEPRSLPKKKKTRNFPKASKKSWKKCKTARSNRSASLWQRAVHTGPDGQKFEPGELFAIKREIKKHLSSLSNHQLREQMNSLFPEQDEHYLRAFAGKKIEDLSRTVMLKALKVGFFQAKVKTQPVQPEAEEQGEVAKG